MDGKSFYRAFLAGTSRILENQQFMNKINVFPVPDGDTGTNLAATMRYIVEKTVPHHSLKLTVDRVAAAALDGARGNSGIIFAQFLYGLSKRLPDTPKVNVKEFSKMVNTAMEYAVKAIEKPVEGTVITVIRDWAESVDHFKEKIDDFILLMRETVTTARESLKNTPKKLEALRKHKVVDAGAQGFVYFLEGVMDFMSKRDFKRILRLNIKTIEPVKDEIGDEDIEFRYCTEAVIEGKNLDPADIKSIAKPMGNSLVVAGADEKLRIHVHTNQPADLFYKLRDIGDITYQKADDMLRQYEAKNHRKYKIALVTDSSCDLPQEELDNYQVNMIPIHLHMGRSHYLDKVTIMPDQFYQLLPQAEQFPTTSQPAVNDCLNLYSFLATYYDSIISVHLSKHLSGTWNTSRIAAEKVSAETGKKITVINSRQLSGALGLMVLAAARDIDNGLGHDAIVERVESMIPKSSTLVSVKTFVNMVKGGRVSPMKGWLANALNLKPIVAINEEGKSELYEKAFSQKGNMKKVLRIIAKRIKDNKVWKYTILHAHDPQAAAWMAEKVAEVIGKPPDYTIDISPVVGLNAGPGAVAISFLLQ
jgi:DegV family protein with EDD domain